MAIVRKILEELGISENTLREIKEKAKEELYEHSGFFPSNSEGCCMIACRKLAKVTKGTLRGGYFTTDSIVEEKDLEVPSKFGVSWLCGINSHDSRKLTHWWIEFGNYIIDLTVEQFNRFLEEPFDEIEIFRKDSKKGERYEGNWWK